MPILDSVIRTIACDAPDCNKSVLFDRKQEKETFENPENVWLKSTRVVQSADGRNIVYCSDVCEVKGAGTGKHNIPEAPKIVPATNPAAIAAAAKAAEIARNADQQIRSGGVQLTD